MAGKDHIKASFEKVYELGNFSQNVLLEVFGENRVDVFNKDRQKDETNNLSASEKKIIHKVLHYGDLTLDDTAYLKLYEITLQSKVRIEQSKVGIQQYIRKNLLSGEGALVNFINPENKNTWRLTLVASDAVLTEKGITNKKLNAKRYTFIVGASEQNKTISDRFAELEKASTIVLYPSENDKNGISLVNTFSVEKLSTTFFDEYTLHYKKFVDYLENSIYRKSVFNIDYPLKANKKEINAINKPIRDFVKKMLGRIVFLYFVQKKGWLGASNTNYEDGSDNFIFQLFIKSATNENFYEWLSKLFFETLNKQRLNEDFIMPDKTSVKIPYLNGGLFDPEEYDNKLLTFPSILFHSDDFEDVILTDKLFKTTESNHRGFLDFLNSFNFTVHEDSPEDHTVAVDPEMLGHIFENLLEDNKDKGAFYTPKEIVHYMCQESLIEFLKTHLDRIDEISLIELVKNKNITQASKLFLKNITNLLDNVKICDPAIGSGAFPMGLLQEIFILKELIAYETNIKWEPAKVKESIIQNSIYGVDIEKGAVDIARLRFWLSLIVNEEKPKPLPNLDYKIVVGDSLLSKFRGQSIEIDWDINGNSEFQKKIKNSIEELVNAKKDFFELKKEKNVAKNNIRIKTIDLLISILVFDKEKYFKENSKTKSLFDLTTKEKKEQEDFEKQINGFDSAIKELEILKTNNEKFDFFDWKIDFAELLNENFSNNPGFDIVIGNPPYVSFGLRGTNKMDDIEKNIYKKKYKYSAEYKISYYALFMELAIKLLNYNGNTSYIVPDSFLVGMYFSKIRNFIINNKSIKFIDLFTYKVFGNATVGFSVVYLFSALKNKSKVKSSLIKSKDDFLNESYNNYSFNQSIFDNLNRNRFRLFFSKEDQTIIEKIELNSEYLGKYLTGRTGIRSKIGQKEIISKIKKNDNYKKTLTSSSQIKKNLILYKDDFVNLDPSLLNSGGWDFNVINNPKILIPQTGDKLTSAVDYNNYYHLNNIHSFKINDIYINIVQYEYISSLLNSNVINFYYKKITLEEDRAMAQIDIETAEILPIKIVDIDIQIKFKILVEYILFSHKIDEKLFVSYFEQIIDGMVYELYFSETLKQYNRTIIEYLNDLIPFTNDMGNNQKMEIINTVFDRLNEKNHPVRVNLFNMNSIPEIAIIEGKDKI